ncbi:MAG: sugar ABC transporter ATP-binding protein [Bacillota bacterium]
MQSRMDGMDGVIIKTAGISKEFSGVYVLKDVNVEIRRGEVFGIVGENGAGKSTFIKILGGTYTPSEGQIFFDGKPVHIRDAGVAKRIGIAMIPQEVNLVSDLNVYENIFLGNEYRVGAWLLDKKKMMSKARELLHDLHTDIAPDERIDRLSVAQKRMVEIAKAITHDPKVLIMDEPTASLTQYEIDVLLALMRRLKERGVTVIFISHRLKEVKRVCDRVMVLRDGEIVSIDPAEDLSEHEIAKRMVGRELDTIFPEKVEAQGTTVLRVEGLSVKGVLHDISFDLKKGEILGFAGLIGAGRTELAEALIGVRRKTSGKILVHDKECVVNSPGDAIRHGIAYLSEDRQGIGILTSFNLVANTTLVSLGKYCRLLINARKEREKARFYVDAFNIKAPSIETRLEFLSGGNQQKVSLAKSLDPGPEVFILDEPTRGIDVNAKKEIYDFIRQLVTSGISCILISSELEEIIGMCSRVAVMRDGRIAGILEGDRICEEEIMYYATGLKGRAS